MTYNKTITTNVLEQVKSAVIIALIVGIATFIMGVQYQKSAKVSVNNSVIVQAEKVAEVKK